MPPEHASYTAKAQNSVYRLKKVHYELLKDVLWHYVRPLGFYQK